MPNPKNYQHDTKSHHSIIFFYLYKINHAPTKLNPTNQTSISNPQFLIVILNSQTATLKLGSSNKTTTKKIGKAKAPPIFFYLIISKIISNNLICKLTPFCFICIYRYSRNINNTYASKNII